LAKLTEGKLAKLKVLIDRGFSNGEISRAIGVSDETVRKHRGEKKDDIRANKPTKIVKRSGKRGAGDPGDNRDQEGGRKSGSNAQDPNAIEERPEGSEGPAGDPGSKGTLIFVGGKKYMGKKEGSEAKEENEYQCYNCDHVQGSPFAECPKCGASNSFEE